MNDYIDLELTEELYENIKKEASIVVYDPYGNMMYAPSYMDIVCFDGEHERYIIRHISEPDEDGFVKILLQ